MSKKVSLIKWSNSFPGIIAIVYEEFPALVLLVMSSYLMISLYDSTLFDKPGKFLKVDANREHSSQQYFNDAVVCMDWGHGSCSDYLAVGLANGSIFMVGLHIGDVIVRPCKGGIFKEEIFIKEHDLQKQSCISLSWRSSHSHVP